MNRGVKLPRRCECGGKMLYSFAFGRVFSCCDTCTPVVKVKLATHQSGTAHKEGTDT